MDKSNPPESFGVFKPVGHTLLVFRGAEAAQAATSALHADGFAQAALTHYSPAEMLAQVDAELPNAGVLASIGQELNLIKAHRALAVEGCHFLVVHTPEDADVLRVTAIARRLNAVAAQHYGHFLIDELIETVAPLHQVFESPDRGLDIDAVDAPAVPSAEPPASPPTLPVRGVV